MATGTESAVEAVELEAFSTEIPSLIAMSKSLYSLAQDRFTKVPSSFVTAGGGTTRPSARVPFRAQGGAAISQGTGDGDNIPTGNMSQWGSFNLSPVWFYASNTMSALAEYATKGKDRGLVTLKADELKNSLDSTIAGLEGVLYGDSSGAVTQIPSTATLSLSGGTGNQVAYITGVRAMSFTDNQIVQIFPSEGGSSRGNATISVNDPASETLFFSTILPSGTQTGDYIMIAGSSGIQGDSVYGTTAWINSSASGTLAGYNRATYPNRITSPSINLNGGSVVASLSQRIEALLGRAMGADNKTKDSGIYLMGEDQAYSIATTNYYNKQIVTQQSDSKGNGGEVPDTSKKYFQREFGGRPVNVSYAQPLGRIDLMLTDEWYIFDMLPVQLFDYGSGLTFVPVPASGGGWTSNRQFTYVSSFNLACSAPKHQLFVYGASNPLGN